MGMYANMPGVRLKHGLFARKAMAEIERLTNNTNYALRCVKGDKKALNHLLKLHEKVIYGYRWHTLKSAIKTICLDAVYPHFQEHLFWKNPSRW